MTTVIADAALPPDLRHLDALLVAVLPAQQAGIVVGDKRQRFQNPVGSVKSECLFPAFLTVEVGHARCNKRGNLVTALDAGEGGAVADALAQLLLAQAQCFATLADDDAEGILCHQEHLLSAFLQGSGGRKLPFSIV